MSQFYCRAKDTGLDSAREIALTREFIDQNNLLAKIIVGSIRSVEDVEAVFLTRGHIATITPELIEKAFSHPKTQLSIDEFAQKYEASLRTT